MGVIAENVGRVVRVVGFGVCYTHGAFTDRTFGILGLKGNVICLLSGGKWQTGYVKGKDLADFRSLLGKAILLKTSADFCSIFIYPLRIFTPSPEQDTNLQLNTSLRKLETIL